ncbi:hypothetical protein [Novosphingobium sp. Gsoil 351]|uniref:hypothetical protein n=1 Tax=Novosphingobium sp. Gsoil 351 TaxID=2675225 RepID=UPI0012B4D3E2|nr:hypothetical protein [Novosphingobium sp. Gsoil 351]QGN55196.1 hypothetical protein GKE62_12235 [Novosphingobium sp. Gsoil 351]
MIRVSAALLAVTLAGCATTPPVAKPASTGISRPAATRAVPTRVRPSRKPPVNATPQFVPGVEGVIGNDAAGLIRQFGKPRLDVIEGDARKLQFSGTACVLDAYLYPPVEGREPLATYIDARRASDGQDVDRAACIAALRAPRP